MKPILFNTEMVRAILDGRKTVIRRGAFPNRDLKELPLLDNPDAWWFRGRMYRNWGDAMDSPQAVMSLCRFRPGDILYVRETWVKLYWVDIDGYTHYDKPMYYYAADGEPDIILRDEDGFEENDQRIRWHPCIHMPKEAARIFLRVTDVRVERLQDILEDPPGPNSQIVREGFRYTCDFTATWENTIKKADRGLYGWDANPWVWVIEFERCEKPKGEQDERFYR